MAEREEITGGSDANRQLNKRLEKASQDKNEAEARMSQYYQKMKEYQDEADKLRLHVRCFMNILSIHS